MSRTFKPVRRIGPSFDDYLKKIYGPNAAQIPAMQRGEIEQAYYAGIQWMLGVMATQLGPGAALTDNDSDVLEGILREVEAYYAVRHASLTFNFERGEKTVSRAAPSVQDIVQMAERVNAIALGGNIASLEASVMDHIYSAVPGSPGQGMHIFENALHADVMAGVLDSNGAWRFWRRQHNDQRKRA